MLLPPVGAAAASLPPGVQQTLLPPISTKQSQPSKKATVQVSLDNIVTVNKKLVSITSQALDILAAEIGVGIEELVDSIAFTDLGCDSLMSLTVSGRIRDELEIDIHSHEFQDYPTIGEFKNFLRKFEGKPRTDSYSTESTSSDSLLNDSPLHDSATDTEGESKATTPMEDDVSPRSKDSGVGIKEIIRSTIASEMGFEVQEISDITNLAELGMDSLMALSVLSALREKTELTLPADLLTAHSSIRDIETALDLPSRPKSTAPSTRNQSEPSIPEPVGQITRPIRYATSVLLQGNSRRARKHLWIIPDGGGSATSYGSCSSTLFVPLPGYPIHLLKCAHSTSC
jgi:acyl carrier protein